MPAVVRRGGHGHPPPVPGPRRRAACRRRRPARLARQLAERVDNAGLDPEFGGVVAGAIVILLATAVCIFCYVKKNQVPAGGVPTVTMTQPPKPDAPSSTPSSTWAPQVDASSSKTYYYNTQTGDSVWEKPAAKRLRGLMKAGMLKG